MSKVSRAISITFLFISVSTLIHAETISHVNGPVEARVKKEERTLPDYFAITFYKPSYFLPGYYTGSPYNAPYIGNTPNGQGIKSTEVKYQVSLKAPLWRPAFNHKISAIYFAYTQLSYWQLYSKQPFFRETDYEPELFLANEVNWSLVDDWNINFLNFGVDHQSNGMGNELQRGWNRVYLEAILSNDHWMASIRPWYIAYTNKNNKDIGKYLGYGRFLLSYKYNENVFSVQINNLLESGARYPTAEVTWSFALIPYIKGYIQASSGYGQSLIEYDHHSNNIGIGVAFNDWI